MSYTRIQAALAVARRGSLILMLRRREDDLSYPGTWCFPGGQVDPEDSDAVAAAVRELHEETGLLGFFPVFVMAGESVLERRQRVYEIHAFTMQVEGDVRLSDEHIEFCWLEPQEALGLTLAGPFTKTLLERLALGGAS